MGFQFNQESAMKAGGTVRDSGPYIGVITSANYTKANTGTIGLELTLETKDGAEFKYMTLWYQKADGSEVKGGSSAISAIMGINNLTNLSEKQVSNDLWEAPELIGKGIGLLLQKVWYTKNNNAGDGYKFEIRLPFNPQTKQTLKEQINNEPAEMVERMASTLVDKDDRTQAPVNGNLNQTGFGSQSQQSTFGQPNQQQSVPDVPENTFG